MDALREPRRPVGRRRGGDRRRRHGRAKPGHLAADAAATAEAECVFLAPAALAAAKQALASLYAERLSALDAVLESATVRRGVGGRPILKARQLRPAAAGRGGRAGRRARLGRRRRRRRRVGREEKAEKEEEEGICAARVLGTRFVRKLLVSYVPR